MCAVVTWLSLYGVPVKMGIWCHVKSPSFPLLSFGVCQGGPVTMRPTSTEVRFL
ncbi:hypothetical protein HYDPIDRAFT_116632 [Hydnomerulius pinastri MD-312]|uniref:Uncharacterized protein n=1 Tax=Hydnomerulius pinastri MD-312 TaxID=994086 RepID=A0A0C9VSQ3_9AGAM|nr:hypothetical protein HYDPIDRAFT_116632 [Hydnomerulius pinastri MD-312]